MEVQWEESNWLTRDRLFSRTFQPTAVSAIDSRIGNSFFWWVRLKTIESALSNRRTVGIENGGRNEKAVPNIRHGPKQKLRSARKTIGSLAYRAFGISAADMTIAFRHAAGPDQSRNSRRRRFWHATARPDERYRYPRLALWRSCARKPQRLASSQSAVTTTPGVSMINV